MLARHDSSAAVVRFRMDRADGLATAHGLKTLTDKAAFFNITRFTYKRIMHGHARPGEEFIAAVLTSPAAAEYPAVVTFENLFEVVAL